MSDESISNLPPTESLPSLTKIDKPISQLPIIPDYRVGRIPGEMVKIRPDLHIEAAQDLYSTVYDMATKSPDQPEKLTWEMSAKEIGLNPQKWENVYIETSHNSAVALKKTGQTESFSNIDLSVQFTAGPEAPDSLNIIDKQFNKIAHQIKSANPDLSINPAFDDKGNFIGMNITDSNGSIFRLIADAHGTIQASTKLSDLDGRTDINDQINTFLNAVNIATSFVDQNVQNREETQKISSEEQELTEKISVGEKINKSPERDSILEKVKQAKNKIEEIQQKILKLKQNYDNTRQHKEQQLNSENQKAAQEQLERFKKSKYQMITSPEEIENYSLRQQLQEDIINMGQEFLEQETQEKSDIDTLNNGTLFENYNIEWYL